MSKAILVAAELGLADLINTRPMQASELARHCGCDSSALHRLLRGLCTIGICNENASGAFELGEMGEYLRSGSPESLRDMVLWWGRSHWELWDNLMYSVRTGRSARSMLYGSGGFDFIKDDPEAAAIFHRAMSQMAQLENSEILRVYDFSRYEKILDVGGGYGELLLAIMAVHQAAKTVLFDLEETIAGASARSSKNWPAERCELVAGDFFEGVPSGANLHILKNVIHDWGEKDAIRILSNCARALPPEGRLLVVERVLPAKFVHSAQHRELARSDLTMLLAHAAEERTLQQFNRIAERAGLTLVQSIPTATPLSLIEFTRGR